MTFIPIATSYIFGTLLTANGNMKFLNITGISGVVLNIILNYILILKYKALGATIATLLTQFLIAILQVYYSKKQFQLKISISKILLFLFYLIMMIVIISFFRNLTNNWTFNFFITFTICTLLGFLFKFIDIRAFNLILSKNNQPE